MAGSVVPAPEVAQPSIISEAGKLIGTALAAFLAAVGVRKLRKPKSESDSPDFEAMAAAWFAEKDRADTGHRDAIVDELRRVVDKLDKVIDAIHESNQIVRDANEKTRERVADLFARSMKP